MKSNKKTVSVLQVSLAVALLGAYFFIIVAYLSNQQKAVISTPTPSVYVTNDLYSILQQGNQVKIFLSNEILDSEKYRQLYNYLLSNKNVSEVDLYLAGNGGDSDATNKIISTIRSTGAHFKAVVYGDVYSGHAFLAMAADEVQFLSPNFVLLFHLPAVQLSDTLVVLPETICYSLTGTDRGVSIQEKCIKFMKKTQEEVDKNVFSRVYPLLTKKEIEDMKAGNDILVFAQDIVNRAKNHREMGVYYVSKSDK